MTLHYGCTTNRVKGDDELYLKVFEDHPLYHPSFVYIGILEHIFKYNQTNIKICINYWDEGKHKTRDKQISGKDLLEHSPEVAEFVKMYYPQHSL